MPTSHEDLAKKAEEVQKLREQVVDAEATRVQREQDLSNDLAMGQLEVEEAALRARLATAKAQSKVTAVRSGAEAPISALKEQMERSVAQQQAAEDAVKAEKGDQ